MTPLTIITDDKRTRALAALFLVHDRADGTYLHGSMTRTQAKDRKITLVIPVRDGDEIIALKAEIGLTSLRRMVQCAHAMLEECGQREKSPECQRLLQARTTRMAFADYAREVESNGGPGAMLTIEELKAQ